jgi:hypothetical protein
VIAPSEQATTFSNTPIYLPVTLIFPCHLMLYRKNSVI